jgi:hypothetical protein
MKRILLGLILLTSILAMTGCLNYSEETWLNQNGSGKLKMEIAISEAFMSMSGQNGEVPFSLEKMQQSFKGAKGVKLISSKSYNKNGNRVMELMIEFKSLKSLEAWMSRDNQSGDPGFIGKTTMTKNKKGQVVYSRVLAFNTESASPSKKGDQDDPNAAMGEEMMSGLFANYVWQYTIHFPYKVISANTANNYIDRKTNTVRWDLPLSALAKKPQHMQAVLRPYNFFESILHALHLYN